MMDIFYAVALAVYIFGVDTTVYCAKMFLDRCIC